MHHSLVLLLVGLLVSLGGRKTEEPKREERIVSDSASSGTPKLQAIKPATPQRRDAFFERLAQIVNSSTHGYSVTAEDLKRLGCHESGGWRAFGLKNDGGSPSYGYFMVKQVAYDDCWRERRGAVPRWKKDAKANALVAAYYLQRLAALPSTNSKELLFSRYNGGPASDLRPSYVAAVFNSPATSPASLS